MNKIIYPFILLLLLSCGNKQLTFDDVDKFDFEVLPKSCIETNHEAKFKYGEYETGKKLSFCTYSFSNNDRLYQSSNGNYSYIHNKNKKEIINITIDNNDSTISRALFIRGQQRRIYIDTKSRDSTIQEIKEYTLTYYYPDKWREVYDLNKDGRAIKSTYYNSEGEFIRTTFNSYNDKGLLELELTNFSEDKHLDYSIRYEYPEFDKKGNWIKKLEFRDNSDTPETITIREIKY